MGRKSKYLQEEINYIKDNYRTKTYKEIADHINTFNVIEKTEKQIRSKARLLGLSKVQNYNRRYFEVIDTPEKAYWLGFIFADGWIHKGYGNNGSTNYELGIELSVTDREHLVKFANAIGMDSNKIKERVRKGNWIKPSQDEDLAGNFSGSHETSVLRVHSKDMYYDLIENNVIDSKTNFDIFPNVKDSLYRDFLRGYFDGDGSIYLEGSKGNGQCHITCASENILNNIKERLMDFKINTGNIYKEHNTKYRLYVNKKEDVKNFLDFLYKDADIYLDRKYQTYKEHNSRNLRIA